MNRLGFNIEPMTSRLSQKIFSVLLAAMLCVAVNTYAATCTDIFPNAISTHTANGNINLSYHSYLDVATSNSTLQTKTLTDNSAWLACGGSSCNASGVPATSSTPTFLTAASSTSVSLGYRQTGSITSGNYSTIDVGQEAQLTFNSTNGLYKTGALTTNYKSILIIKSGDIWINGDLTLAQATEIRRLSSGTSTRIFVNGNVSFGYQVFTSGFTSDQLLIYATGTISSANELNFTGYLYAQGNVSLKFKSVVNGAVSGANFIASDNEVNVNYQGSNLGGADFAPFCSGASSAPVLLGSWHMDERIWNGTVNEVQDSSGKGNHGRARIANGSTSLPTTSSGTPAYTLGNQSTCYYGAFDSTSSPARTYSYVELTGFPSLPQGFTFAAWIRSTNSSAQHQRILVRDDAQNGWGLSLADGTGQPKLRFFSRNLTNNGAVTGQGTNPNCGVFCVDTNAVISSNVWYYVAAVVDTGAKKVTLYVYSQAGSLIAKAEAPYSGTWTDGSGTAAIGGETSASAEGVQTSWHFLGNIDEVNIYSGALSQISLEALLKTVRTCAGPDHYELELASTSIACAGTEVKVRACANSLVPCVQDFSVNGNVNLSTNAGTLSTTTLGLSSGSASAYLKHASAADGATATVTLSGEATSAINSRKCCTGTSSCSVANSCSTTFNTAGFIFSNTSSGAAGVATQLAGVTDNNLYLRAVKTNSTTKACEARLTGSRAVGLAYKCKNPTTCVAGQSLTLAGTAIQSNANTVATSSLSYTNNTLTFDSNGAAPIAFKYTDVGQVQLFALLNLTASGNDPAYKLEGASNDFVVKPYSLVVSSVKSSANIANPKTTASGAGFVAAGDSFKVAVQAQNANGDPTPNFGREIISEASNITLTANTLIYPQGGLLTALTNGGSFAATSPQGTFENINLSWNQVGSMTLVPSVLDNDYLAVGDIPNKIVSETIGRFYPHHYRVVASAIGNSCTTFSYLGQPAIQASVDIYAEGSGGSPLENYDAISYTQAYGSTMATPVYVAENANSGNGSVFANRINVPAQSWNKGVYHLDSSAVSIARELTNGAPEGPYTSLQLGVHIVDSFDSRTLQNLDMNPQTLGSCSGFSCTDKSLGSVLNMRYGRLRLDDAFGPESVDLPVSFITEYWGGSFFVKNTSDICTNIARSAISYPAGNLLTSANQTVALSGGTTTGVYGSLNNTPTQIYFTNGDAMHYFQKPSGSATGNFDVNVDLTNYGWLRYDWNQDATYNDLALPTAHFGFGQYRGHDRIIYWREIFE